MDEEEIIKQVTDRLMNCVHCGEQLEEAAGEIEQKTTPEGTAIVAEYDCPECGGHQRNTAELT
jgi:rubredoxin